MFCISIYYISLGLSLFYSLLPSQPIEIPSLTIVSRILLYISYLLEISTSI